MPGNYTHTTRPGGTVLTANIYNADHQKHVDNAIPLSIDDYSVDIPTMQGKTDPGEVGSENQATSLAGELTRLRFVIAEMKNTAQWYTTANFNGSKTYDPPSLADGAGTSTTVTCTGAVLGDFAMASFSLDLQGITVTAYVSAADTVTVRFQNETGGILDLGSGTLRVRTFKGV